MVFAGFTVTDVGQKCSDVGLVDLSTGLECEEAVTDAKPFNLYANYKGVFSDKDFRKGCYMWDIQDGNMHFNEHSTGGSNYLERTRSVCKKGNIICLYTLTKSFRSDIYNSY